MGFCLGAVAVALQDGRNARNVQGSTSALTPFLFHLDWFLRRMNLWTWLLLARLAKLGFEAHQQVSGWYGFGRQDLLCRPSQALVTPLSLFGDQSPKLHLW